MPVYGGLLGAVNGIGSVQQWTINDDMDIHSMGASNTRGGKAKKQGTQHWSGTYIQFGANPLARMPGDVIAFEGYIEPSDNVSGVGPGYSGNAMIDSIQIVWDWNTNAPVMITTSFSGDNALVHNPSMAQIIDETALDVVCAQNDSLKVLYGADGYQEWDNLVTLTLNISRANLEYANSSTTGWKRKKKGPFDWTVTAVEDEVRRNRFAKGDFVELHVYASEDDYWLLKWGMVKSFTGITVNRDTGEVIKQTVNFEGSIRDYAGVNVGSIILPGETTAWAGEDAA